MERKGAADRTEAETAKVMEQVLQLSKGMEGKIRLMLGEIALLAGPANMPFVTQVAMEVAARTVRAGLAYAEAADSLSSTFPQYGQIAPLAAMAVCEGVADVCKAYVNSSWSRRTE